MNTSLIRKHLNIMPDGFSFSTTSTVAFDRMNYRVAFISIVANTRVHHKSTVRMVKDGMGTFMLVLNLIVLFSPLRVFLPLSFLFFALSLAYFTWYSLTVQFHVNPSTVMLFITGVQLFVMGIVCEQISAIRREMHIR
jgi:hypothetical protein